MLISLFQVLLFDPMAQHAEGVKRGKMHGSSVYFLYNMSMHQDFECDSL
jgi:hypothetical protein